MASAGGGVRRWGGGLAGRCGPFVRRLCARPKEDGLRGPTHSGAVKTALNLMIMYHVGVAFLLTAIPLLSQVGPCAAADARTCPRALSAPSLIL